ncbi:hypothetical protein AVEN_238583-1 [Araneus ventricosus]|uniref:Uncharacterized protein n=1 Tax=Araneus ventricosus TaxID=182803 RepID=A0A4Y2NY97_ARAVE|nr:hypothetical protein AVEN_238583-1 [Araneus ventricosus]
MFSIEDCIIQLASTPGSLPVRFRPPTVRRKREKADESISRIHMSTKSPYTKVNDEKEGRSDNSDARDANNSRLLLRFIANVNVNKWSDSLPWSSAPCRDGEVDFVALHCT